MFQSKDFQAVEPARQNSIQQSPAFGGAPVAKPSMGGASAANAPKTIVTLMQTLKVKIVHKDDIMSALKNQFDASTIQAAIDRLLDDGTIYTAHSNDTFILDQ